MKIEAGRIPHNIAETAKKHRIGLGYAESAILVAGGLLGMVGGTAVSVQDSHRFDRQEKELVLSYPSLPSEEELKKISEKVSNFNTAVIKKVYEELGKGETIVDFKEIKNLQPAQDDVKLLSQNQELISKKEALRNQPGWYRGFLFDLGGAALVLLGLAKEHSVWHTKVKNEFSLNRASAQTSPSSKSA